MNVSGTTQILMVASILLSAALIGVLIFRMVKEKGCKKAGRIVLCAVLAVLCAVNCAVYGFSNIINQALSSVKEDNVAVEEATEAARDMTRRLAEEGIVLLENNGALPLQVGKVNLFGMASLIPTYGGSGSGASDESGNVTLIQGLENAGFAVNPELAAFYEARRPEAASTNIFNLKGGDYNLAEPASGEYSDSLLSAAKSYSDVAVVVFARNGGEGGDLPQEMSGYTEGDAGKHYLELQSVETDLLELVKANFGTVIVLINSSNAMELGFLEDGIDAALWIGGPGSTGMDAVGEILAGTVNPSGRLPDTYAYDLTTNPGFDTCGNFYYTANGEKTTSKYVEYMEGIYVGYRFYETAAADGYLDYDSTVQYPFGYGLSYTSFDQKIVSHTEEGGTITVQVEVTNTGDRSGKDVVQLYCTAPYTPGGIEKAHVILTAFDKTKELAPGEGDTLTLSFTEREMASYDYTGAKGYILEAGDYEIKLMENSHTVIDSFTHSVPADIPYDDASNLFDDAAGDVVYVSRADWAGTLPKERVESKEASQELLTLLNYENINDIYCSSDPEADAVTTGGKNGLRLEDMIGVDYDDEQWELLLDQLTVEEMAKLVGYGGFATAEVSSIGKAATIDIDGPAGLNALTSSISGVQYPSETLMAATFNQSLLEEMGAVYAQEAHAHGVNGVYAPAANIHRTPFSGRNFEYYSEDPLLSGKLGAAETRGIGSLGIVTYVKHFALNDQETNRSGVATWCNEQAIREIYLKPFEYIVKEGGTTALMSSYNRIGAVWAGGSYALLTGVVRNEWGFRGIIISDYDNGKYMNTDQALRAGADMMLSTLGHAPSKVTTESNYGISQMRRASRNILYTVVNSRAYTAPVQMVSPVWLYALIAVDAAAYLVIGFFAVKKRKADKKSETTGGKNNEKA